MTNADTDIARAIVAALSGDLSALDDAQILVDAGYNVNGTIDGETLLQRAVRKNDLIVTKFLLDHGAQFVTSQRSMTYGSPPVEHSWSASEASDCGSAEMAFLLGGYNVPFDHLDREFLSDAIGAALILPVTLSVADIEQSLCPPDASGNPERCVTPFLLDQIRTGRCGYGARADLLGKKGYPASRASPTWSFQRFGRSVTRLPDGSLVLIAGEHEDHYDPDFQIFNDVVVLDRKGGVALYRYSRDAFPATDFHSATLLQDHIILIGSLGYPAERRDGETQVLRLHLDGFHMDTVATTGDAPGWIHGHDAKLAGDDILISGGKTHPGLHPPEGSYALNLPTMVWRRIS